MLASQIPTKVSLPFATNAAAGYIRTVPVPSQITITPGAASYYDGFPPVTFEPVTMGGIPPAGEDFNGLLNNITAWNQWQSAGATVKYDATFQTAIGGYPQGAIVASATNLGTFWLSLNDNNATNPDASGSGWVDFRQVTNVYAVASGTANAWVANPPTAIASLIDGAMVRVRFTSANTISGPKINVSGLGLTTIYDANGANPLPIGWLPLDAILQYNSVCSGWSVLNTKPNFSDALGNISLVQTCSGNPNGKLAGNNSSSGPPSFAYDIVGNALYVCTTTGTTSTAVWTSTAGAVSGNDYGASLGYQIGWLL